MAIVYALIARGKVVMAEYTNTSGNFPTVTRVLLSKIPPNDAKMSYLYDSHIFHYVVEAGITYLCMGETNDAGTKHRLPFAFLDDVRSQFIQKYGEQAQTAIAFSFNDEFSAVLRGRMEYFNSEAAGRNFDQIGQVKSQIDDVKEVMVKNIEQVLERGDKIELLVDKTDRLNQQAFKFEKQSRRLKNTMWWKKMKFYGAVAAVVAIVLFGIVSMACGGLTFDKCKSHDDNDDPKRRALLGLGEHFKFDFAEMFFERLIDRRGELVL
ncbi:hypothetical protein ScalyP_jg7183 [Parmales sp. scaly parma]|nr:hypothetical protein ScalyP_jg7183 [Parmales sp. scaly parma]